jgi:putative Ca2+/H+ antiporter (TMEM165/GDT1 family)
VEGLVAFGAALGLIALLELGDKTQLLTISLATRRPWASVLGGATTGLVAATAIGAAIGGVMAVTLTGWLPLVRVGGGIVFVVLGAWMIVQAVRHRHVPTESESPMPTQRNAFLGTAGLLFVAEFGDKTQLAVVILAASYAAPVSVFIGASLAEALIAVSSVIIGASLARFITQRWLGFVSSVLFLAAGVLLIFDAMVAV